MEARARSDNEEVKMKTKYKTYNVEVKGTIDTIGYNSNEVKEMTKDALDALGLNIIKLIVKRENKNEI